MPPANVMNHVSSLWVINHLSKRNEVSRTSLCVDGYIQRRATHAVRRWTRDLFVTIKIICKYGIGYWSIGDRLDILFTRGLDGKRTTQQIHKGNPLKSDSLVGVSGFREAMRSNSGNDSEGHRRSKDSVWRLGSRWALLSLFSWSLSVSSTAFPGTFSSMLRCKLFRDGRTWNRHCEWDT